MVDCHISKISQSIPSQLPSIFVTQKWATASNINYLDLYFTALILLSIRNRLHRMPSVHLLAPEVVSLHRKNIFKPTKRKLRSTNLPDERDGPACNAFLAFKAYGKHSVDAEFTPSQDAGICEVSSTEKTGENAKLVPLIAEAKVVCNSYSSEGLQGCWASQCRN